MAWIALPDDGRSDEIEDALRVWTKGQKRPVPPIIDVMTLSPRHLRAVLETTFAVTFGGSSLGRYFEELIATTVSALNDCFY